MSRTIHLRRAGRAGITLAAGVAFAARGSGSPPAPGETPPGEQGPR